jgi:hypothetical protein
MTAREQRENSSNGSRIKAGSPAQRKMRTL